MSNLNFFLRNRFKDKVILWYPDILFIAWTDPVPYYSSTHKLELFFVEMCFSNPSKSKSLKLGNFLQSCLNVFSQTSQGWHKIKQTGFLAFQIMYAKSLGKSVLVRTIFTNEILYYYFVNGRDSRIVKRVSMLTHWFEEAKTRDSSQSSLSEEQCHINQSTSLPHSR